jgi:hypothetical protein
MFRQRKMSRRIVGFSKNIARPESERTRNGRNSFPNYVRCCYLWLRHEREAVTMK